ncbi:hypothetical protein N0V93_001055 [Gnomoniopsis smithogilvyi]|uniref:Uncharacterized protein n=1 Tax=Gnomoniopsis smithogilvyi TaxID=1191159 RepID=A0A9W8Z359_9PEZI|nr:hypothetical protein N0V93_001055 [Gnomoniopsis smithogilvyi]
MILLAPHQLRRLRQQRRPLLALLLALFLLDALILLHGRPRTKRVALDQHEKDKPSVFIVSVHRNTANILPEWSAAVLALIDYLGNDKVYFSALESGSQDGTKAELSALADELDARGVSKTIDLGKDVYEQLEEMWTRPDPDGPRQQGWIWNEEDNVYDLRRITYLAKERNRAMQPLEELEKKGTKFDKILWINDVVFNTEDFATLLRTNDGNYAAACSMDYKHASQYYDTFALRDDLGQKTVSNFWPWFLSPTARVAAQRSEPMRVESCWNGMVLFDAAPFYGEEPLRFRAIPDSLADFHLEGSECCLIHADNPLSARESSGVWLNPNRRYVQCSTRNTRRHVPGALHDDHGRMGASMVAVESAIAVPSRMDFGREKGEKMAKCHASW